ncbi:hypothetical protein [Pedobacter sp. R20-19]|uniref:hypothetical protein n=1 Tax=Pedobacter sp. R20-19 TaxID=1270196 RepID=UPI000493A09A|nr:hypothetical protein [Pedobacter sp. R20-19]
MATAIPDIVDDLYKNSNYEITDDALTQEILNNKELSIRDLWLLPQYPFDEWRKKHDYPRILENLKKSQMRFSEWMEQYNLSDEVLMDGYISSFLNYKYKENKKANLKLKTIFTRHSKEIKSLKLEEKRKLAIRKVYRKKGDYHLIKVSYEGKTKHQVWDDYDGETQTEGDGEPVIYEYILSFVSYSDWCIANNLENKILDRMNKIYKNTKEEQVYLNGNIRLLKMGGIAPPANGLGILLRGKNLEFINVSGLILKDTIHFSDLGNLEFNYCTVDNLNCSELNMPHLSFHNCSAQYADQ